jgi:flagellar basal-body rod protein FlgB
MSQGITVEAVRLALGMHELQAKVASRNIAGASVPGARALQLDLVGLQAPLDAAAAGVGDRDRLQAARASLAQLVPATTDTPVQLDAEVANMVASTMQYQALAEALGRHFSLMRLSISGRV